MTLLSLTVFDAEAKAALAKLSGRELDRAINLTINRVGPAIQRAQRRTLNDRFTIRTTNARQFLERMIKWRRSTVRTLQGTLTVEGPNVDRKRGKVLTRHESGDRFTGTAFIGARDIRRKGAIPRALYPTALGFATFRGIDGMPTLARGRGALGGRTGKDTAPRNRSQGKRRTFLTRTKQGDVLLMQRTSKTSLRVLWRIERDGTRVRPALRFAEDAQRMGPALLSREAARAVSDVVRWRT